MAVEKFSWVGIGNPMRFVLSTMNGAREPALTFDRDLGI